jgi:hypothetical protein
MNVKTRILEPVDIAVAVGILATVLGGAFMFMTADGILEGAISQQNMAQATDTQDPMQWVQPALGQAIVNDMILAREGYEQTIGAAAELNNARLARERLQSTPFDGFLADVTALSKTLETDHEARAQFVMGRRIVEFTGRGVRAGIYGTGPLAVRYNRRMVRAAEREVVRMDGHYRQGREAALGETIVASTFGRLQLEDLAQQRLRQATLRAASVQEAYSSSMAEAQEQLATVTMAAVHHEEIVDRFDKLASADASQTGEAVFFSSPRSLPEVPMGLLVALSFGLIGIFLIGVSTRETETAMGMSEEPGAGETRRYHKIAS